MTKADAAFIREYFGHNGHKCKVFLRQGGIIERYGSPDPTDRSLDFLHLVGFADDFFTVDTLPVALTDDPLGWLTGEEDDCPQTISEIDALIKCWKENDAELKLCPSAWVESRRLAILQLECEKRHLEWMIAGSLVARQGMLPRELEALAEANRPRCEDQAVDRAECGPMDLCGVEIEEDFLTDEKRVIFSWMCLHGTATSDAIVPQPEDNTSKGRG